MYTRGLRHVCSLAYSPFNVLFRLCAVALQTAVLYCIVLCVPAVAVMSSTVSNLTSKAALMSDDRRSQPPFCFARTLSPRVGLHQTLFTVYVILGRQATFSFNFFNHERIKANLDTF